MPESYRVASLRFILYRVPMYIFSNILILDSIHPCYSTHPLSISISASLSQLHMIHLLVVSLLPKFQIHIKMQVTIILRECPSNQSGTQCSLNTQLACFHFAHSKLIIFSISLSCSPFCSIVASYHWYWIYMTLVSSSLTLSSSLLSYSPNFNPIILFWFYYVSNNLTRNPFLKVPTYPLLFLFD